MFRYVRVHILVLASLISLPIHADTSDWLQVQRFQQQLEKARAGDPEAMYDVARRFERGRGTDPDMAQAAAWYRKCLEAKPACQARLGILYFEGRGVQQDHRKAFQLLQPAARVGIPLAQYQLGLMYEYGTVVRQDRKAARLWYRKALENGDYRAEQKLAQLRHQPPAPPPVRKPRPQPQPRDQTRDILLGGLWLNGDRPADILPSPITRCEARKAAIHCVSAQERTTDTDIITTRTESVLDDIADGRFRLTYTRTVLTVQPKAQLSSAPIDDEDETVPAMSAVKAGQKSRPRRLECRLLDARRIRCEGGLRSREFHLPDG